MRIVAVHEKTVSIASPIANAFIDFSKMTCSVVAVVTDAVRDGRRVVGYGFNSNGRYGQGALLRERFFPRLDLRHRVPHRHVAVGTLDMAVWDAVAKIAGKPLYRLLADRYRGGKADDSVWVYAAGGYYHPDKGLAALQDEMRSSLARGYRMVKMKIGAVPLEQDLRRVEAVLEVVGKGEHLAVDANGRFDLPTALAYAEALRPYRLFWYEEAGDPLDYALQAELGRKYAGPMATGENLFSHQDARNLLLYGGLRPDRDTLQFDCALSYGLVEYLRTLRVVEEQGWSSRRLVPHGGHQMSLNLAAGLHLGGNESYPEIFQPFGGFADGIVVEDGRVGLPDVPGIGFETKKSLWALLRTLVD